MTISKKNNLHEFQIFHKPTQTESLIPSSSNHPMHYKMASFRSMINRLLNIPMSEQNYKKELKIIKHLANKNGYKSNIIEKMIGNIKRKRRQKNLTQNSDENLGEGKKYISVPYNKVLNKAIRNTFKNSNYKISYQTRNNVHQIINQKTNYKNLNTFEKSGVYKITCSDCPKYYIGKTKRSFKVRFKEHIQALRSNNATTMKSNFAEHLLSSNHSYKSMEENMKILEFEKNEDKLTSKEDLQIFIHNQKEKQNILNTQSININNPIYNTILKLKNNQSTIANF